MDCTIGLVAGLGVSERVGGAVARAVRSVTLVGSGAFTLATGVGLVRGAGLFLGAVGCLADGTGVGGLSGADRGDGLAVVTAVAVRSLTSSPVLAFIVAGVAASAVRFA